MRCSPTQTSSPRCPLTDQRRNRPRSSNRNRSTRPERIRPRNLESRQQHRKHIPSLSYAHKQLNALKKVPIVAEVFKQKLGSSFNPKRLFGVTTLDVVRASTFVSEILSSPSDAPHITIPVIGGHSGVTIIPLLSQSSHALPANTDLKKLTERIQFGGDEVVKAKDGAGSATLSMAYAGAQFAEKILRAVGGEKGIVVNSYVNLDADKEGGKKIKEEIGKDLAYFSVPLELGVKAFFYCGILTDC
jgi:malate/lactate dehydrogenase